MITGLHGGPPAVYERGGSTSNLSQDTSNRGMLTEPVKCPEQNICKFDDSKGILLMSTRQEQSHNRLIEVTCIIFLSMCVCA